MNNPDPEEVATLLDGCRGPLGRPLAPRHRAVILEAIEGDPAAWDRARAVQVAPYISLGFAMLKLGQASSLHVPPPHLIVTALQKAVEMNRRKTLDPATPALPETITEGPTT